MNLTYEQIQSIDKSLPAYIFDTDRFKDNISRFRQTLSGKVSLCYSVKANPWLIPYALDEIDFIEVCSAGELDICTSLRADPATIISGGICRDIHDFNHALSKGIRRFSIESLRQLALLNYACHSLDRAASALLRLTNNNQFGMTAGEALNLLSQREDYPRVRISGLHFYPGTQRLSVDKLSQEFALFLAMLEQLKGFPIEEIAYGSGLGVDYFSPLDERVLLEATANHLNQLADDYKVTFESGRALTADAGMYITKLVEIKQRGNEYYYIVNGGRHQISYYGHPVSAHNPPISCVCAHSDEALNRVTVCGALCNAGDILARNIRMPAACEGDYILFHLAGAYAVTEGTALFLSRELPAVFSMTNGQMALVRDLRPTFDLNLNLNA